MEIRVLDACERGEPRVSEAIYDADFVTMSGPGIIILRIAECILQCRNKTYIWNAALFLSTSSDRTQLFISSEKSGLGVRMCRSKFL